MVISKRSLLVTTALSSLLLASTAYADAGHGAQGQEAAGQCHGVNACKGHGACKGVGHSCEGKNSCEGKGWLKMSKKMCESLKDGRWTPMPRKS